MHALFCKSKHDMARGSGKTREMIKVLDNYFFDPRPKVPIFPKD